MLVAAAFRGVARRKGGGTMGGGEDEADCDESGCTRQWFSKRHSFSISGYSLE
jgi:hypothetical protein